MLGPNPSLLRQKLGVVCSLLIVSHCAKGEIYGDSIVSVFLIHFDMGIFSFTQCVRVAQLVSELLSEGTVPCVAVDLVSVEQASSGASCVTILVQNLQKCFHLVIPDVKIV